MAYTFIVSTARARVEPVRRRHLLRSWLLPRMTRSWFFQPGAGAKTWSVVCTLHAHEILMLSPWTGDYETTLINRVLPKRVSCGLQPSRSHFPSLSSPRLERYRYDRESAVGTGIREFCNYQTPSPAGVTSEEPAASYPVHPSATRRRFYRSKLAGRRFGP